MREHIPDVEIIDQDHVCQSRDTKARSPSGSCLGEKAAKPKSKVSITVPTFLSGAHFVFPNVDLHRTQYIYVFTRTTHYYSAVRAKMGKFVFVRKLKHSMF